MKTHEILKITPEKYEHKVFETYFKWCNVNSSNDDEFQRLIANAAVNGWFLENLAKVEAEFCEEAMPYTGTGSMVDIDTLWLKGVMKLFYYYPKPLLNDKPITVIGQ